MRSRHLPIAVASLLAACAVIVSAAPALAQESPQPGYAANTLNPSERGSRWFVLDSLDFQGNGRLALGVVNDYSYRPLVDYASDGTIFKSVVRNQYQLHLGASVTIADRVRLGVNVPLQAFADGHATTIRGIEHRPAEDVAVGDVRFSADVRVLGKPGDAAVVALGGEFYVPSGSESAYTGDGKPRFLPRVLFAGQANAFVYAAKLGFLLRARDEAWGDGYIGNALYGAVSAGVQLANKKVLIGPEVYAQSTVASGHAFEARTTPVEALLGAHVDLPANLRLGAGAGVGLTRGYGVPIARALFGLEWVPGDAPEEEEEVKASDDRDGDGIADCVDACAFTKGVASDDPTKNGCAPDDDHDGVPDDVDACKGVAGVPSANAAQNGCPPDTDGDGVVDAEDACPREAGPRTNDPNTSGCADRDADGIPDKDDACKDKPGVQSSNPKFNGCAADIDADGVPNDADACPDVAGKSDPDPKKNGCPKAFLSGKEIKITEQVKFKTGSAEILGKESDEVLGAVLAIVKEHPSITLVVVEGHTDKVGNPKKNKELSAARAQAVATWLTGRGVAKERVKATGFGDEKPIDTNDTEAGRANNRRVEFHVEQGTEK